MITNINDFKKLNENKITLQQDNHDKISVTLPEDIILKYAKKFLKKYKLTMRDIKNLGSSDYDKLIKYLSTVNEEVTADEDKEERNNLEDMLYVGDFEV